MPLPSCIMIGTIISLTWKVQPLRMPKFITLIQFKGNNIKLFLSRLKIYNSLILYVKKLLTHEIKVCFTTQ